MCLVTTYPEALSASELAPYRIWRTLAGPKPPQNPLARLIVSSPATTDTTPADSVRAEQANLAARRLTRLRILAQAVHAPLRIINAIDRRLAILRAASTRR